MNAEIKINNSIGKDAVILTAAKIITMIISFASAALLARFRTLDEYGTYAQLIAVITLATSLFTLGLPNSINYFLSRGNTGEERKDFLSIYYTLSTLLCVVMGMILALATPLITMYFDNDKISDYAYILGILPWAMVTMGSISNVLVVYGRVKELTLFNIVRAVAAVVVVIIVEVFDWSFKEYMILYLIENCIMSVCVYVMISKLEGFLSPKIDYTIIKEIFKFSIPAGLAGLVGTLTLECDKLVIGRIFDTETMALYSNAAKELPLTIVASSLTAVLLPQIVRKLKYNRIGEAIDLWKTTIELSYIFMAFVVTALMVFAPQIMTVLYSEKYIAGVNIFRIYSAVLLLRITYFGMILNASGKTNLILYSSILTLVVNVVLDITLYHTLGILGPAIATFISIFAASITQLLATSKLINISIKDIFPWTRIAFHSGVNIVWGAIALVVLRHFNVGTTKTDILNCVISGILITVIYILIERKNILKLWKGLNVEC